MSSEITYSPKKMKTDKETKGRNRSCAKSCLVGCLSIFGVFILIIIGFVIWAFSDNDVVFLKKPITIEEYDTKLDFFVQKKDMEIPTVITKQKNENIIYQFHKRESDFFSCVDNYVFVFKVENIIELEHKLPLKESESNTLGKMWKNILQDETFELRNSFGKYTPSGTKLSVYQKTKDVVVLNLTEGSYTQRDYQLKATGVSYTIIYDEKNKLLYYHNSIYEQLTD